MAASSSARTVMPAPVPSTSTAVSPPGSASARMGRPAAMYSYSFAGTATVVTGCTIRSPEASIICCRLVRRGTWLTNSTTPSSPRSRATAARSTPGRPTRPRKRSRNADRSIAPAAMAAATARNRPAGLRAPYSEPACRSTNGPAGPVAAASPSKSAGSQPFGMKKNRSAAAAPYSRAKSLRLVPEANTTRRRARDHSPFEQSSRPAVRTRTGPRATARAPTDRENRPPTACR